MTEPSPDSTTINSITAAILAGGSSRRMGRDKALLPVRGIPLIETIYRTLAPLFSEVLIVTNTPEAYGDLPCPKVPDLHPGEGSLAGLQAALVHASHPRIFVVACDMPMLSPGLIRHICSIEGDWDVVVPVNEEGHLEPLHALYGRSALDEIQKSLARGDKSIRRLYDRLRTRQVRWEEIRDIEGAAASFRNLNTPREYEETIGPSCGPGPCDCEVR